MSYENRLPPEGINVSRTNVLAEIFWMLAGFVGSVLALAVVLWLAGGFIASRLPFSWEETLAGHVVGPAEESAQSAVLQKLADQLAKDIETDVRFHLIYVDDDEVNAYATLGGIITIHRGLIDRLHSENALAFVIAHEMGHVLHRDPARAMGGGLLLGMALMAFGVASDMDSMTSLAKNAISLTMLDFSREEERHADETALQLVGKHYGHLNGSREVFEEIMAYETEALHGFSIPEFLSSHPETKSRTDRIAETANTLNLPLEGKLTPLPTLAGKTPESGKN